MHQVFGRPLLGVVVFVLWLGIGNAAVAGVPQASADPTRSYLFDIPAQALRDALFAYTEATGLSVLVEDGVASRRQSVQVQGSFTAEDALRILLSGTNLEFQYTTANAFTLVPSSSPRLPPRDVSGDERYFRVVQTVVKRALCGSVDTLPGQYRIVVQLWIGGSGVVLRSSLLGSTGSRDRDRMLSEMLGGLSLGQTPPAGLPQPVTLVILPRSPDVTRDCGPIHDRASR